MITNRTEAARRKLLNILPRSALERLSGIERPWHANKPDLLRMATERWDVDEVRDQLMIILNRASK